MATQVSTVYLDVCRAILEDPGVTAINLMSLTDFYNYLSDTIQDFVSRTGLIKKIFNIPGHFFIGTYTEPNQQMDVHAVSYDGAYIYKSSGWYLDNTDPEWQVASSTPERWREDEIPPKSIQVEPLPTVEGYQAGLLPSTPGYGQIAATSSVNDFDITAPAGGYGAISGVMAALGSGGAVYAESINPGYGTVSYMLSSTGNIQMISTVLSTSYPQTLTEYIYLVPDSFVPYIKYGVLARIWAEDGEYKSPDQAQFAAQRYQEGVALAAGIMSEQGVE